MNIPKITVLKDIEEKYNAILDSYTNETSSIMKDFYMQVENAIEYILRNHVTPPIKGEITKSKLKWRGITSIVFRDNDFVGIQQ